MSDKKYPYIGDNRFGQIALIYGKDSAFHVDGKYQGEFSDSYNEAGVKNIAHEYLANTYGKCESQEHADFICKIAEIHGFNIESEYEKGISFFNFYRDTLNFWVNESAAKIGIEKLIHLPLPPKENEMGSQLHTADSGAEMPEVKPIKPIYTKEMHERGLLPKVGMECLIAYKGGNTFKGKIKYISKDGFVYEREDGVDSFNGSVDIVEFKPIPTIEDELHYLIVNTPCVDDLTGKLLTKFNITPKGGE